MQVDELRIVVWRPAFFTKAGHFVIINGGEITGCIDKRIFNKVWKEGTNKAGITKQLMNLLVMEKSFKEVRICLA